SWHGSLSTNHRPRETLMDWIPWLVVGFSILVWILNKVINSNQDWPTKDGPRWQPRPTESATQRRPGALDQLIEEARRRQREAEERRQREREKRRTAPASPVIRRPESKPKPIVRAEPAALQAILVPEPEVVVLEAAPNIPKAVAPVPVETVKVV